MELPDIKAMAEERKNVEQKQGVGARRVALELAIGSFTLEDTKTNAVIVERAKVFEKFLLHGDTITESKTEGAIA